MIKTKVAIIGTASPYPLRWIRNTGTSPGGSDACWLRPHGILQCFILSPRWTCEGIQRSETRVCTAQCERTAEHLLRFHFHFPCLALRGYIVDPRRERMHSSSVYQIIYTKRKLSWISTEWSGGEKWNWAVRKFLKLSEYCAVKFSDADITDNAAIQRYTSIQYKTLSHMIAYGADHCSREKYLTSYGKYEFLKKSLCI